MIPSLIRAAGATLVKTAIMAPPTMAKRTMPDLVQKMKNDIAPKIDASVITPAVPKAPDPMKPPPIGKLPSIPALKVAGVGETALKMVQLLGDDAVELALRRAASTTQTAATIPVAAERVHKINDPSYQPDGSALAIKRLLAITGKIASNPEAGAYWENDPGRVQFAFSAQGPASKVKFPDEGNIGTGDFPKMGGAGNAQEYHGTRMPLHPRTTSGTGTLDPATASNQAFDKLRAYLKTDTAPITG